MIDQVHQQYHFTSVRPSVKIHAVRIVHRNLSIGKNDGSRRPRIESSTSTGLKMFRVRWMDGCDSFCAMKGSNGAMQGRCDTVVCTGSLVVLPDVMAPPWHGPV
mmetsp:Transcript_51401/g.57421  ORF Transcript_51401/g.57421 Transcript_51401/m.57421 type:complete len:104 (-) Transcript_51401:160-471(-)